MPFTNPNGHLLVEIEHKIATLTFGHPASNAFPTAQLEKLTKTFESLSQNNEVAVIVLKSHGQGAFCAGASFDELLAIENETDGKIFFSGFANVINAMRSCKKLIVGRVHGKAVGGGVGLASACDYVFATKNASIKLSELAIGIGPFVIEPVVSRKIGTTATTALTLDAANWKTAIWAHEKGLFTEIFDNVADMDMALGAFAEKLSGYNCEALQHIKTVFWANTSHWETLLLERAAISGTLVLSEFTKNALREFKK